MSVVSCPLCCADYSRPSLHLVYNTFHLQSEQIAAVMMFFWQSCLTGNSDNRVCDPSEGWTVVEFVREANREYIIVKAEQIYKNEKHDRQNIRPHTIPECAHSMCRKCCETSGKCATCNGSYDKRGEFKVPHDTEDFYEELNNLRIDRERVKKVTSALNALLLNENSKTANVKLLTLTNKTIQLAVNLGNEVSEFKKKVEEQTGVLTAEQRLIFQAKQLEDSHSLSSYRIEEGSVIHLATRLVGGTTPTHLNY